MNLDGANSYQVTTICKPNACLEEVVMNIEPLVADFCDEDFVVVLGGTNNAFNGGKLDLKRLSPLKSVSMKTNVVLVSAPYCPDRFTLNGFIYKFNKIVYENIVRTSNIKYVDCNKILTNDDFTQRGVHMRVIGKSKLLRYILNMLNSSLLNDRGYCYTGNLIYVKPTRTDDIINDVCDVRVDGAVGSVEDGVMSNFLS